MLFIHPIKATAVGLAVVGISGAVEFGQDDCHLSPWINATSSSFPESYLNVNGSLGTYGKSYGAYFCAMKVEDGKLQKDWLVNSLDFWVASDDSRINAIQVGYANGEKTSVIGKAGDEDKHTAIAWDPAAQYIKTMGTDPNEGNLKGIAITTQGQDGAGIFPLGTGVNLLDDQWLQGTLAGVDGYTGGNGLEKLTLFLLPETCNPSQQPKWMECNGQWI